MNLSTVHGSSYYSGNVNPVANMSYTPLNTLIRHGTEGSGGLSGAMLAVAGVGIILVILIDYTIDAYIRPNSRRQRNGMPWYSEQAV